jgi:protocatechuate 3,4-dioxygenase beta subunit
MLVSLAFALLLAQAPDSVTVVEGKIVDSAGGLPVAGARVVLARIDKPGAAISAGLYETKPAEGDPDPKADRAAVVTGDDGIFRFRIKAPARFSLFVDAKGFVRTPTGVSPETTLSLEPGHPKTGILLRLTRELSLSGRVIDADTGEPVPKLAVRAHSHYGTSRVLIPNGGTAMTDGDGRFRIERVMPGDYYLEALPPLMRTIGEPKPVEDFRHAVQKTHASTWYPGVERFEEAAPVRVVEGVVVEGLEIKTSKRRTAAIRGRVLGDPPGEVSLGLTRIHKGVDSRGFEIIAKGKLQTGAAFEIDRLAPGSYYLIADAVEDRRFALMPLEIGEENQDGLDLHLRKPLTLTGTVRVEGRERKPEDPALPSEGMRVGVWRVSSLALGSDPRPVPVESQGGTFTLDGVIPDRYQIYKAKQPEGYRISEVRYNGTAYPHAIIPFDPAADAHRVEITLAPANASIFATVTDGDRPVPGATVLAVPDPVADEAMEERFALSRAQADGDGRAAIPNLLPGRYRIIAYPKDAPWQDDPGQKHRLRTGREVRVSPGQVAVIEVRAVAK